MWVNHNKYRVTIPSNLHVLAMNVEIYFNLPPSPQMAKLKFMYIIQSVLHISITILTQWITSDFLYVRTKTYIAEYSNKP